MKLAGCSCGYCRMARKTSYGRYFVKYRRSATRSENRKLLKLGRYDDLQQKVKLGYMG